MATVPELKAQAEALGLKITSRMRKPEIEQAIAEELKSRQVYDTEEGNRAYREAIGADPLIRQAESDANKINSVDPTPTLAQPLSKAERARRAGACGVSALPMSNAERASHYHTQHSLRQKRMCVDVPATPAQARRMRKKGNKMSGFSGCTLADYREMRRRMKRAGMIPAGQR